MNSINKYDKKYYDPELVSIILTALAALGSTATIVGGVLAVIEFQNSRNEKRRILQEKEQHKISIQKEIRYALHSLSSSVNHIKYELENLEELYNLARKLNDDFQMKFGNGSMLLNKFEFDSFYRIQTRIILEAHNIYSNLRLVEELLLSGEHDFLQDYGYNTRMKHVVEETVNPINRLISEFGELDIKEFQNKTIRICRHIVSTIGYLEENLRRNYM